MTGTVERPTYYDAVQRLNSTQTDFRDIQERRRQNRQGEKPPRVPGVEQMRQWLRRIGYNTSDLNRLNIVHVAGTKGKGTTCAYVNSILHSYQQSTGIPRKIGLYTSPHLVAVRERIQINSAPISEEQFTRYFFEVWDTLESSAVAEGADPALKPAYFRFLTLMSFHVFLREGVDTAVYEVGIGGEFDTTNVFEQPAVTGITTLGIDHVKILGDTIDKIAWHKAGIMKRGCPAFTVQQVPEAKEVLDQRAAEKEVELTTVDSIPALQSVHIRPSEDFQRKNASLAIALSQAVLGRLGLSLEYDAHYLPDVLVRGLETVVWRGRCETLTKGQQHWHLDGAHTEDSLKVASSWFGRVSQERELPRVLIFNQQSNRDAVSFLKLLHHTVYENSNTKFDYAVFCTNMTYKGQSYKVDLDNRNKDPSVLQSLSFQRELAAAWHELDSNTEVEALASIEEAIDQVIDISNKVGELQVLVTGSLHLVGGALSVLEGDNFSVGKTS